MTTHKLVGLLDITAVIVLLALAPAKGAKFERQGQRDSNNLCLFSTAQKPYYWCVMWFYIGAVHNDDTWSVNNVNNGQNFRFREYCSHLSLSSG